MEKQNDNLSEKLTASELIRANRRAEAAESERLKAQSLHYKEEINVLRDQADRNREIAPLKPADDAYILDTTSLDIKQVLGEMLVHIQINPA